MHEDYARRFDVVRIDGWDETLRRYCTVIQYIRTLMHRMASPPSDVSDFVPIYAGQSRIYVYWWKETPHRKDIVLGALETFRRFAPVRAVLLDAAGRPQDPQPSWTKSVHFGPDALRGFRENADWRLRMSTFASWGWIRPAEPPPPRRRRAKVGS